MGKFVRVKAASVIGLEARKIDVELDIQGGLSSFSIVGLPDKAVEESKERVVAAIKNSGAESPLKKSRRVTVNLAPADLKKEGALFDLPIALGFLSASGQLSFNPEGKIFIGELSLDGELRPIKGALAIALMAKEKGFQDVYLPCENASEAAIVKGLNVYGCSDLSDIIAHLEDRREINRQKRPKRILAKAKKPVESDIDFAYIRGQRFAKRALEIAAAGSHNILLVGPPGSGKTILARSMPTIFPPMDMNEVMEVTRIFSVAGLLSDAEPLKIGRPFRHPHHSSSSVSLIGGGTYPKPGEITLSHKGVLFLDEFPEFQRNVMEALRQPLEDKEVTVSRAAGTVTFPADFTLVAAMNPCPCGYLTDPDRECTCSVAEITRYKKKISGPILDRIDIHVEVPRIKYEKMSSKEEAESSAEVRQRVAKARKAQKARFKGATTDSNSNMSNKEVKRFCKLDNKSQLLLKAAVEQYFLSARSYFKILKVARTIADLEGNQEIERDNLSEAIQLRVRQDSQA